MFKRKDPFDRAMTSLVRSVGDELDAFMDAPRANPVSVDEQRAAGRDILESIRGAGHRFEEISGTEDEAIDAIVSETRSQIFEETWLVKFATRPTMPAHKRAQLAAFIESKTGRPVPADQAEYEARYG